MFQKYSRYIALVFFAVLLVTLVVGRNNVVNSREEVYLAASQVQSMIQRRNDLIPSLIDVVESYATHEEKIFTIIAESQAKLTNAIESSSVSETNEANEELSKALNELLALVQKYPELGANEQFINLQYEIAGSENRINIARLNYNEVVTKYNKHVKTVPGIIFAKLFEYDELPYFGISLK